MRWRLVALTVLSLCVLIVLPACGDGEGEKTSAPILTPTPIVGSIGTLTPTPSVVSQ